MSCDYVAENIYSFASKQALTKSSKYLTLCLVFLEKKMAHLALDETKKSQGRFI